MLAEISVPLVAGIVAVVCIAAVAIIKLTKK